MRLEDYIPLRLAELCEKHGYTKYRLSQLTGMSQTALANIISKKSIPTIPTLERICGVLGVSMAQFFAGEGVMPDLTNEQKEILETWAILDTKEREILSSFVRSLKK